MNDFKKAAALTAILATAAAAGCATVVDQGVKIGTDVAGDGVKEAVTQTQEACETNPDHAVCKGAKAGGQAKATATEAFKAAKDGAKNLSTTAGGKIGSFFGRVISGKKGSDVDCSVEENKPEPICQ